MVSVLTNTCCMSEFIFESFNKITVNVMNFLVTELSCCTIDTQRMFQFTLEIVLMTFLSFHQSKFKNYKVWVQLVDIVFAENLPISTM